MQRTPMLHVWVLPAVVLPGRAPADAAGNVLFSGAPLPADITTSSCPAGFYCSGGQLPPAGYPTACGNNLSSAAGADSVDACSGKCVWASGNRSSCLRRVTCTCCCAASPLQPLSATPADLCFPQGVCSLNFDKLTLCIHGTLLIHSQAWFLP